MNMNSVSDPTYIETLMNNFVKHMKLAANNSMKMAADEVASSSPTTKVAYL